MVDGQESLPTKPVNMVAMIGEPLQINCEARDSKVAVSWYDYSKGMRRVKEVSLNSDNYYKDDYTIGGIPPVYNLQIHELKMSSGGVYGCAANDDYGYNEVIVLGESDI